MTQFLDFPGLRKRLTLEPRFGRAIVEMCERLGIEPDYLLSVMSIESAGTFRPDIVNPNGGATGLIQFMPPTARGLGTTVETLAKMSAVEQLQYVERFFRQNGRKVRRDVPGDYYMAVFMPAFVGEDPSTVLGIRGSTDMAPHTGTTYGRVYDQNKGLDRDKDGKITIEDVWQTTLSRIASARQKPRIEVPETGPLVPRASSEPPPSLPPAWRSSGGPSDLPVLRVGAKGTAVALAQMLLGSDVVTGVYTEAMALDFVRPFQRGQGLDDDAVIGRMTWMMLTLHLKERPTEPPPP